MDPDPPSGGGDAPEDDPSSRRDPSLTALSRPGSGTLPIPLVPWSLVVARRRLARQAQQRDSFATIALAVVLGAMFTVNLSVTAIAVAVPVIADDFSTPASTIVWAVTGPILVSAVLGPTFGKLGDQRGHRTVFVTGLVANAVCTILIAAAWSAGSFIAFRLLAAVGAAAIGPAALAFVNLLFGPRDRAVALGWWSFVGAGSPVIGVVVGGIIIDRVDWRWVFIGQAPLVLVAAVVAFTILPQSARSDAGGFDVPGAALLGVGVGAILLAVTLAAEDPTAPAVLIGALVGVAGIVAFAAVERRSPHPLIPPEYWRLRGFVVPTLTLALLFASYMGSFVLAPLMLQNPVFGISAAVTGQVVIARPLLFSLSGPVTGRVAERTGERPLALFGGVAIVASMLVLAAYGPDSSLLVVVAGLGLAGLGMGTAAPVLTATVANAVSDEDLGVAGAAQQMLQQVGLVVGVQVLQAVQATIEGDALDGLADGAVVPADAASEVIASYRWAFTVAAAIAVAGVAVSFALAGRQSSDVMADSF